MPNGLLCSKKIWRSAWEVFLPMISAHGDPGSAPGRALRYRRSGDSPITRAEPSSHVRKGLNDQLNRIHFHDAEDGYRQP